MKIIRDITNWPEASNILSKLGIEWDRALKAISARRSPYSLDPTSPFVYFMIGDCDVGYFVEGVNILFVHGQPRPWEKNLLKEYEKV